MLTQDNADRLMKMHYERLALSSVRGFRTYRERYPHRPRHRSITIANVVNDEQWSEIVNSFDQVPGVKVIEQSRGLRFLGICGDSGEVELLLWFKKVGANRSPRPNKTRRSAQLNAGRTLEMFKAATVLVVGYYLNRDQTEVVRVSISRPLGSHPEWFIDLEIPQEPKNVVNMNPRTGEPHSGTRVIVHRIKQPRLVE